MSGHSIMHSGKIMPASAKFQKVNRHMIITMCCLKIAYNKRKQGLIIEKVVEIYKGIPTLIPIEIPIERDIEIPDNFVPGI